jgi:hypothetical protein
MTIANTLFFEGNAVGTSLQPAYRQAQILPAVWTGDAGFPVYPGLYKKSVAIV